MNRNKCVPVLVCICFFAVLVLPGFVKDVRGQGEEGKTEVEKKSATKEKLTEDKEEFERKTKEKLNEFDKKMDELEAKVKKAGSEAKAEGKEQLQELKKKRAALKRDMEKFEASSDRTWKTVKRKVEHSVDELEEAYNKVRDKFRSE